ncbi:dephospho-CoA kinase [Zhengella mangrovi]|uniref:Dephospho-CoA kinase n=1 Tax=Zhengella mangrovi TaxID=1982044 RepID=A0A2G1QTS7_9HYPH|nr:dephospho-CoA kinase [Zhengella mangrovi]PHP68618.1 dephospho-CoA kinase [Zhengella mangrovi]
MRIVGLTGSIGMGKSTTAAMFADAGIPVHDADATVHRLYAGRAAPLVEAAFPGTVVDGAVDRNRLSAAVVGKADAMKRLEAIVHPLVREEEQAFLESARSAGAPFGILDIPLLFETGGDRRVDAIIVVSADAALQRERVLARPGMTEEKFEAILARQVPDAEKRARADFVIDTGHGLDHARAQVADVIAALSEPAVD